MPATSTDRLYGMTTSVAVKPPCRVATNAAITLSGEQTVNGVAVVTDDRVLVKDQADTTQNGIWIVNTSAWSRSPDFDGSLDAVNGTIVLVQDAASPGTIYELQATNPVIIGTSALVFNLSSNQPAATFAVWGGLINSATGKTTPVDTDAFAIMDSAASNATKKLTWANLKATLKTYFDTLYAVVGAFAATGNNTDITSLGNNTSTVYTTGGTSTAYTITPNPVISAYAIGPSFVVNFHTASGLNPTIQISGIATPPNLVTAGADGTYSNVVGIPSGHRGRVTLISTTQAVVENMSMSRMLLTASQPTTSGTSIDFTNIPGWVKQATPILKDVSTSSTSPLLVQIGSGSLTTSGYASTGNNYNNASGTAGANSTAGFVINLATAADAASGAMTINLVGGNDYVSRHSCRLAATNVGSGGGSVTLGGAMDRLRLTTVGGVATFDGGSVALLLEGY